ncbi:hypothetical protein [Actimicrobium sp. CCI2.3]|uniref:hypothetical protein n=1 Tax=Actimicrobium sp. CCI2.3 TaxID=3048616 RepID=UPI002AB4C087|nr:hypothetical protein [Actimicrobium sp. CCI2.3]MDY7574449.1 hypothetical protein [Actimicrobium sp. CCI2.3]MEB0022473.1 hypothetical protein [Actimicrobium sp. CCI2.3]
MDRSLAMIILALSAASASADNVARVPVNDVRALMVAAIDAPGGDAHGVFVGSLAQAISQRFRSDAPITIDVTTLSRLTQAGCCRLQVVFAQDGVVLPADLAPKRRTVVFDLNYCRDGLPPRAN